MQIKLLAVDEQLADVAKQEGHGLGAFVETLAADEFHAHARAAWAFDQARWLRPGGAFFALIAAWRCAPSAWVPHFQHWSKLSSLTSLQLLQVQVPMAVLMAGAGRAIVAPAVWVRVSDG